MRVRIEAADGDLLELGADLEKLLSVRDVRSREVNLYGAQRGEKLVERRVGKCDAGAFLVYFPQALFGGRRLTGAQLFNDAASLREGLAVAPELSLVGGLVSRAVPEIGVGDDLRGRKGPAR